MQLVRGGGASKWGYFLRAETMHGMFTFLQSSGPEQDFHSRSHGEAFWDIVTTSRFASGGLFVLDEPEAGLSFDAQLRLVALLLELADRRGAQVLMAMVDHYRRYLDAPDRYLRHLLE